MRTKIALIISLIVFSLVGWFAWVRNRPNALPRPTTPSQPLPPPGPAGLEGRPLPPDHPENPHDPRAGYNTQGIPPGFPGNPYAYPAFPPGPPARPGQTTSQPAGVEINRPSSRELDALKRKMMSQLKTPSGSRRTLPLPPNETPAEPLSAPSSPPVPPEEKERAQGRKEREALPMGVVLWDHVPVYESPHGSKKIYEINTGDLVRVISTESKRVNVHPGLDVYLAATTKKVEAAGNLLPDQAGWVELSQLNIFKPEEAREFLFELTPVTLGQDPAFSTLSFYERAMKNPDPVVHRVVGPRLISVVTRHEDYATSWFSLYRDADPKIRAATLAALRERGVGKSRPVIEDLIKRLAELTRARAQGEREVEALAVLDILKTSGHPRVPAALTSFDETWKNEQGPKLNQALQEILSPPAPTP